MNNFALVKLFSWSKATAVYFTARKTSPRQMSLQKSLTTNGAVGGTSLEQAKPRSVMKRCTVLRYYKFLVCLTWIVMQGSRDDTKGKPLTLLWLFS